MSVPKPSDFSFNVKRYFHESLHASAAGTFWELWDGHITANHVYIHQGRTVPPFTNGAIMSGTGTVDTCLIGCDLTGIERPRDPVIGERIYVYGYPQGSAHLSTRAAKVYHHRQSSADENYTTPTWMGLIDERPENVEPESDEANLYEPIFEGMSGGLVMAEDGTALGVLVGTASFDWDSDLDLDHVFDFVSLSDIWWIFAEDALNMAAKRKMLLVDRFVSDDDVTISKIYVDGKFICHGLEDEYREQKVPKETRIDAGMYAVAVRTEGGFHSRYSQQYPDWHRGMLEIIDVPNFTDILIHVGNYDIDTDGCLLVGRGDLQAMAVWQSKVTYKKLYELLIDDALAGRLDIEFRDSDRNVI